MGGLINAIDIASQGLSAQRAKMDAVAQNMANAETVETPEGGPYKRQRVIISAEKTSVPFSRELSRASTQLARTNSSHLPNLVRQTVNSMDASTVEHKQIVDPDSSFRLVYDPTHPDADEQGFVKMPDVDIVREMVDMMVASRAYEANTNVIATAKKMAGDALEI
ncbi:MAG: flagellar basal body rod protein FlgC [candidate division Zixibacteria bacterium]|nr:flagellar basal body rod protein FlgC [candidate division Zixibacteria bacterium]